MYLSKYFKMFTNLSIFKMSQNILAWHYVKSASWQKLLKFDLKPQCFLTRHISRDEIH